MIDFADLDQRLNRICKSYFANHERDERAAARHEWRGSEVKMIRELWDDGATIKHIANKTGFRVGQITHVIYYNGFPKRPPRR